MIEPLRKMESFGSRDEAEAARLLCAVGRAEPLPAVEQRVFASLGRPARLGPRAFRFASVASVSLAVTGALALTVGVLFHQPAENPAADSTLPTLSAPSAPVGLPAPVAPPPTAVELPAPVAPPAPVVKSDPPAPVRAESPRASRSAIVRTPPVDRHKAQPADSVVAAPVAPAAPAAEPVDGTEARVAAAPSEESALVLAGLRALRRQHDPSQAGVLLARYLSRYPQGVLVQEALALAIEAGLARGDHKAAAQLAKQYLDGFPAGRFARLARKALDGTSP